MGAVALPPVEVASVVTRESAHVRLYADDGEIDDAARAGPRAHRRQRRAAARRSHLASSSCSCEPRIISAPRTVQVVSAYRWRASRHGTGEAIDFKLKGVRARELAAYLRQLPRAGVGIYTNPRTQFVHLDVRDQSYHWVDASPPGVNWHEAQLRDPGAAKRDAAWTPDLDLPLDASRPLSLVAHR